jgi:hypothetical protein
MANTPIAMKLQSRKIGYPASVEFGSTGRPARFEIVGSIICWHCVPSRIILLWQSKDCLQQTITQYRRFTVYSRGKIRCHNY